MSKQNEINLQDVINIINERHNKTEDKMDKIINNMQGEIQSIKTETQNNTYKISELEKSIECLKQDKLKNNIKIAGLPNKNIEPNTLVYNLCNLLDINIIEEEFTAYHVRNANFIIVQFDSHRKKSLLIKKMNERKNVMTEEVFGGSESNGQIYVNDQLTPYFARLFQLARAAKRDGKINQVSSRGGKIRVKKK